MGDYPRIALLLGLLKVSIVSVYADVCSFPASYHGEWFSMEHGLGRYTTVHNDDWRINLRPEQKLSCIQSYIHPAEGIPEAGRNMTFLLRDDSNDNMPDENTCYYCVDVLWRTKNILQYRKDDCVRSGYGLTLDINTLCQALDSQHGLPSSREVITMFRINEAAVSCNTMLNGVHQFAYEVNFGGGGICNNPHSLIKACSGSDPDYTGSTFMMKYAKCPGVSNSKNETIANVCLGTWFAVNRGIGYTYAAIKNVSEKDPREAYKCLMTIKDHRNAVNESRWVMSRYADCGHLSGVYSGPVRLVLTKTSECE